MREFGKLYNVLKKLNRKKVKHHSMIAIDFEDDSKGNFLCAGVYGLQTYKTSINYGINNRIIRKEKLVEKVFKSQSELNKYLLSIDHQNILVFFNLNYDKVYLSEVRDDSKTLEVKSRIILMKLKNGVPCIDLMNHVDGSLRDWINYLDMSRMYGIKKVSLSNKEKRVINDAKATYQLGKFLEDFYVYELGIPFMLTIGMEALTLFRMKFFKNVWERKQFYNTYEREAYHGGRSEIFKSGLLKVNSFDINSCYLSIMRDCKLPNPETAVAVYVSDKKTKDEKVYKNYLKKYLGIYHVRVYAPRKKIMVLPLYRNKKLIFPCGKFSGYWTSIELLEALKRGYKILECYSFIYYRESDYYFRDFAEYIWKKRLEYKRKGNKGMDLMIKKIGNSLYGKFAQNNEIDGYFGKVEDLKFKVDDKKHKFKFFDHNGKTYIYVKANTIRPAKFQFVCIATFITSYARVKLLKAMIANEDRVVYCDTDSIKLEVIKGNNKPKGLSIGKDLGQFQFEEKKSGEFQFYRPKFYGKVKKGVPDKAKMLRSDKDKIVYKYKRPLREREAIKRGLKPNFWTWTTKTLITKDDKREWYGNQSWPIELNE